MNIREESERLVRLFGSQDVALFQFLSGQLGILKSQAQMLMGLCGLAITVTGFSGAHMIRSGSWAAFSMVIGIAFILISAILCLSILSRLRWVSQDLCDDFVLTTTAVLTRRNLQQHRLSWAGVFVSIGLAFYLTAVIIAAVTSTT